MCVCFQVIVMPVSFLGSHIKAGNVPCLLGDLAAAGGRSAVEMFFTRGSHYLGQFGVALTLPLAGGVVWDPGSPLRVPVSGKL